MVEQGDPRIQFSTEIIKVAKKCKNQLFQNSKPNQKLTTIRTVLKEERGCKFCHLKKSYQDTA